jgi:HK97 family phage major capsid protein
VSETPKSLEAQNITFGMTDVTTHTSMADAWLSRNLLEDTAFNIESYLEERFAEAAAFDEDDQFMFGDGIGKPLGILPGHANTQGIYEVTTGATTAPFITWDKLVHVPYEIPAQYRGPASWIFNRRTVRSIRTLKHEDTGAYYWQPFQYDGGEGGEPGKLLDYKVREHETFQDLANGANFGLFGDLSAYQIIDRVGMTVERFVDSYTARQNLVCFVMRRRLGGRLLEPWRLTALKVAA